MYKDITDEEYLKKLTLLYVEDDELTREIYMTFLSRFVGTLITANNGSEGVEAYHKHHPDIIITDVQMPVMDGLAMAKKIREDNNHIPIIVLTAFDQGNYLLESINIGIDKYVTKPAVGRQVQEALSACAHRLLVEEQLKYERLRLTYIIEGTKAGSWEWNVLSGEILINERWAELIGYHLEDLIPFSISSWRDLIHPDDIRKNSELLEKCFHGELEYYECDLRMRHKYGQWVWILFRGKVFSWSEDGLPLSMYGSSTDLSIRKQMEYELRQNRDELLATLEAIPDLLFKIDREGNYLKVSASHEERLANPARRLLGRNVKETLPAEAAATVFEALDAAERNGSDYGRIFMLTPEEKELWFELSVAYTKSENSEQAPSFIVLSRDITERKHAEIELKRRNDLIMEERDRLAKALEQIKRLEGIIPICSYCKKIRDDHESWNQLEKYISEHSEAKFSHSICPDCFEEQIKTIKKL